MYAGVDTRSSLWLLVPPRYTEQADQVEVEPAYRVYTHAHRLMMGWATELGPRPCPFVALERCRFRKIAILFSGSGELSEKD